MELKQKALSNAKGDIDVRKRRMIMEIQQILMILII